MGISAGPLDISGIRGTLDREEVLIVGSGPSLGTADLDSGCVFFFVGDSFLRTEARGRKNFLVRANTTWPNLNIATDREMLGKLECTWIFARSAKESKTAVDQLVTQHQKSPSFTFDQRHFRGQPCSPRGSCCDDIEPGIQTLQEQLAEMVGLNHFYSQGATVALHALAIGIFAGAKKVRLVGVEIPLWQRDYRYAKAFRDAPLSDRNSTTYRVTRLFNDHQIPIWVGRSIGTISELKPGKSGKLSVFAPDFPSIFSDFQYLVDAAERVGCEIEIGSADSNLRWLNGVTVRA